ncbi:hypothetical protein NDU88_003932 [Pleurodeles waltl]|uniref:Uncharacterized protein n=1 Tax=Pleurodeles waltl TaxID=8319 RepID=A0AAV7TPT5_PLEWA|nr:hypothetical protein NDU88_003932 [Pleurodeles waltl]
MHAALLALGEAPAAARPGSWSRALAASQRQERWAGPGGGMGRAEEKRQGTGTGSEGIPEQPGSCTHQEGGLKRAPHASSPLVYLRFVYSSAVPTNLASERFVKKAVKVSIKRNLSNVGYLQ